MSTHLPRILAICLVSCLVCFSAFADQAAPAADAPPQPDEKTIAILEKLIDQLGDESYAKREEAGEQILGIGLVSLKQVEEGAKNPDREIRYRCERLRVLLFDRELQRRLEAFAADLKGEKDHGLPAWDRYAKLYGSDSEARQLFVEIFKAEPAMLKAVQSDNQKASDLLAGRAFELQQMLQVQQQVSLGSAAAMLFAAGDTNIQVSDQTQQFIYSLCYQPAVREAVANGAKKEAVRNLLAKFIVRGEGWVAHQGLTIAMQYDIKEGLEPARKLLKSKGGGQPHLMQMAVLAVAKMGGAEDLKELGGLLEDKTVIMNFQINNQRIQCEVRDFAILASAYILSRDKEKVKGTLLENGDLKAFGFDRLEANAMTLYSPHTIGFVSDEGRQKVFANWAEVQKKIKEKDEKK